MPLKDLLKKRDKLRDVIPPTEDAPPSQSPADFTFMRSDTNTQELIQPPTFGEENATQVSSNERHTSKLVSRFRSSSNASTTSNKGEKRLSQRLHLRSASRTSSISSIVPPDLPTIEDGVDGSEEKEARWEERATILAQGSHSKNHASAVTDNSGGLRSRGNSLTTRPQVTRNISDAKGDVSTPETRVGYSELIPFTGDNPRGHQASRGRRYANKVKQCLSSVSMEAERLTLFVTDRPRAIDGNVWAPCRE